MKKRLMAKILSAVMIVSFITVNGGIQPSVAKAIEANEATTIYCCEIDGIVWHYEVDTEGNAVNVEPKDNTEMKEGGTISSVVIPDILEGKKVTAIKSEAFLKCSNLTSIKIPETVTNIGSATFSGCTNLININIPEGVTVGGIYIFANCKSLTNLKIPKGITTIGLGEFYGCTSLASIDIPEGITSIQFSAFADCASLKSIIIPKGVNNIEGSAFYNCTSLTRISVPSSVAIIKSNAFEGCINLTTIYADGGIAMGYDWGNARVDDKTGYSAGSLLISNESDLALKTTIVNGIEWNYEVDTVGNAINVEPKYTYAMKDGGTITSVSIPDTLDGRQVTSIKEGAFYSCISLTNITIPNGVTSIGDYTFSKCSNLTSINIPDSVTTIGDHAFTFCSKLASVNIHEGLTSIGYDAFGACTSLTSINIPNSVTSIGEFAFTGCTNLNTIYANDGSYARNYPWGEGVTVITESFKKGVKADAVGTINAINETLLRYMTAGGLETNTVYQDLKLTLDKYPTSELVEAETDMAKLISWLYEAEAKITALNAEIGNVKSSIIWDYEIGADGIINLAPRTEVSGCVIIPDTIDGKKVISLRPSAFKDNKELISVIIPEGVTNIQYCLFSGCTGLKSISLPNSINTVTWNAFDNCTSLATIYATKESFASRIFGDTEIKVDTNTGYISEATLQWLKDSAVSNIEETDKALSDYIIAGGLETDDVYKNLKVTVNIYPTVESIEAEADITKLVNWISKIDTELITINSEIEKLKELVTELTTSVTSPQVVGKEIILNAKSSGGEGVLQTKFEVSQGTVMTVLKDYSIEDKTSWTPTKAGIYTIKAVVKDSTGKSVEKELTYVVCDPVNLNSVTIDQGSSIDLGKSVNIITDAVGGNGKLSYSISAENNGTIEKISESSQNTTATWTPTKAGIWNITVTAVDESGNKSEKQVTLEVKDIAKNETTIYYKGYSTPYIHYKVGTGSWTLVPGIVMTPTTEMIGYTHKITIDLGTASTLTACFNNGYGSWDSKNGANYTFNAGTYDYSNGIITKVQEPVKTLTINSFTSSIEGKVAIGKSVIITGNATSDSSNIEYKMSVINSNNETTIIKDYSTSNTVSWTPSVAGDYTLVLDVKDSNGKTATTQMKLQGYDVTSNLTTIYYKGYTTPYIHYRVGTGSWTLAPGVAMIPTTEMVGYTHKITIDLGGASTLTACFNNGSGSWDSKNGANYTFNAGTYDYSNGIITKVQEPVKTLTINSFTSNIIGKLNAGTSVILTGNATSDASTIEYKMSVINSNNETKVIKDYSSSNISSWTPSEAGEYTLVLEAKDSNGKTARTEMKVQAYAVSSHITTIYYKGYTTPYIHYKVGNGIWTQAPGVAMIATTEKVGYTHKITIDLGDADTLTACFNNGSGSWDSKNGANYIFNSGTYTYSNGSYILLNN